MSECEDKLALAQRQLKAVQRISEALYSATDLEALQQMALKTALEVIGADAGSVMIYDPETHSLIFRCALGPVADQLIGTSLNLSQGLGIAGEVFLSGVARTTGDVEQETAHIGTVDARTGYRTQSLMTIPLRRSEPGSAPFGVIQLINKTAAEFDESDIAVTEIMGSLVAMAVQNADLAQRARLAAVAYSVGEISHDIGNMLTLILPYVQSLQGYIEDVREGKPQAQNRLEEFYAETLNAVSEGVEQVETRTKEIARAVKGEVSPLVFEASHPFATGKAVVRAFQASAERRGISLSVEGDEKLEAVYDHNRVYNALYNLVGNALSETPQGGSVCIRIAEDADAPSQYVISVQDTGRGMTEEVCAALFTSAARSTKPGGTGLGTQIVRRSVEQHGGSVHAESKLGEGSAIYLHLPKYPQPAPSPIVGFSVYQPGAEK